jgi:Zn finger protein HypA/HybF involved in hydrogenase expression
MIPNPNRTACIDLIANCNFESGIEFSYYIEEDEYNCIECNDGFLWNEMIHSCDTC